MTGIPSDLIVGLVSLKKPIGNQSYLAELGRLFDGIALPREEVLGERVEDVDAEAEVPAADGDVHAYDLVFVGLVDLQRGLQDVEEVGECAVSERQRANFVFSILQQ